MNLSAGVGSLEPTGVVTVPARPTVPEGRVASGSVLGSDGEVSGRRGSTARPKVPTHGLKNGPGVCPSGSRHALAREGDDPVAVLGGPDGGADTDGQTGHPAQCGAAVTGGHADLDGLGPVAVGLFHRYGALRP